MLNSTRDPLAETQEAALLLLSRLIIWFWCPGIVIALALILPRVTIGMPYIAAMVLLPLAGWFLRPSAHRPARWRASAAMLVFGLIAAIALITSGPRALNLATLALLLSLSVLFLTPRATAVTLAVFLVCTLVGITLQSIGWMPLLSGDNNRPVFYRIVTALMAISALGYCAAVSVATLRIYSDARQAANDRLEELRRAREESEALQRYEVKATLATGLGHDLANIVQVMTSSVELLRDQSLDKDGRLALHEMEVVGERATTVLRALLTVGRATAPTPDSLSPTQQLAPATASSTDVTAVLGRLESLLRPLLGRRVTLGIEVESPSAVAIDGNRLEQALLNLALNARDAMPNGGTLRIIARDVGSEVLVAVTDTGHGLQPDVQARIFEPYFTTKGPGKGSGLGLPMVRRIMDQSNGRITVESTLGEGTTFSLWFPRLNA